MTAIANMNESSGLWGGTLVQQKKMLLASLVESADDAIVAGTLDGNVATWNRGAEALYGYATDDIIGRPIASLASDDRSNEMLEAIARACIGEPGGHYDTVGRRKDGRLVPLSVTVSPIRDADGTIIGVASIARDISLRMRADEQGGTVNREIERLSRLAATAALAASLAHDVNNSLASVITNIDWVRGSAKECRDKIDGSVTGAWLDELEAALHDASAGASRIAKVVVDMKRFTLPETDSGDFLKLADVVDWSLVVAGDQLWPLASVTRKFGPTPLIDAPAGRLGQVFVTLLTDVALAMESTRRTNGIVVVTRTDEHGRAVVEIRGHSPMVPPAARGRELRHALSVCRGILDSLGGSVVLEREPGTGTMARVTLPPARPRAAQAATPVEPTVGPIVRRPPRSRPAPELSAKR